MSAKLSFKLLFLPLLAFNTVTLSSCSKQNWYQGAQYASEAQCMKGPVSEYEDCMQQSSKSYDEYNKGREELLIKPAEYK